MITLAKELGAVALHLFLLVPVGCGVEIADEQMVDAPGLRKDTELALRRGTGGAGPATQGYVRSPLLPRDAAALAGTTPGGGIQTCRPVMGRQMALGTESRLHATTKGCLAGTGVCFVSHDGKLFGCGYLPVEVGVICAGMPSVTPGRRAPCLRSFATLVDSKG